MARARSGYAESLRFVVVGTINTVLGYGLFVLLELTFGSRFGYLFSLYVSYAISTTIAFILHRRFTFQVARTGNVLIDFLRFVGVYVASLAVNTAALPALVEIVGLSSLIAQGIVVLVMTVATYFAHKYFSFRRIAHSEDVTSHT